MPVLEPGKVVERYRLDRPLGEGGMGSVWAATHVVTRKHVALKFLKTSGSSQKALHRFLREARAVSAVQHPNVVQVHDVITLEDDTPMMVLDLLDGIDLSDHLARVGKLPLGELARIMVPVISAVGAAHERGIVHRDLKPDNIMLHQRGDGEVEPKVLDFGIAKLSATEGDAAATAALTQTGAVMGTPYYMSPEQVYGEKDVDPRSDVWAIGVILYQGLTGKRPFEGANFGQLFKAITKGERPPLSELASDLPEDVVDIVERMLDVDRDRRPRDLTEPYRVLQQHSAVSGVSFDPATSRPSFAYADTVSTDEDGGSVDTGPESRAKTGDGFSHTSRQLPVRRRWPYAVAAVGLAALAVLGLRAALPEEPTEPAGSSGASATSAESTPAAPPEPEVLPVPHPAASASAPPSAAPASTSARRPLRPARPAPRPRPEPTHSAPPPAPAPAPDPDLPGGVVGKPPF